MGKFISWFIPVLVVVAICSVFGGCEKKQENELNLSSFPVQNYTLVYEGSRVSVPYTQPIFLPNPVRKDATFLGWTAQGVGKDALSTNNIIFGFKKWQGELTKNMWFMCLNSDGGVVTFTSMWEEKEPEINPIPQSYKLSLYVDDVLYQTSSYTQSNLAKSLPALTKQGYTFDGWYQNSNYTLKTNIIPANSVGDKTYYARFIPNTYKVSFNLNNGAYWQTKETSFDKAIYIQPPTPQNENYTFLGWTISGAGDTALEASSENGNYTFLSENYSKSTWFKNLTAENNKTVTFTANWQYTPPVTKNYTVKFDYGGVADVIGSGKQITVNSNGSVYIPNPKKLGYTFVGWISLDASEKAKVSNNGMSYSNWLSLTPTKSTYFKNLANPDESVTLIAKWESQRILANTSVVNGASYSLLNGRDISSSKLKLSSTTLMNSFVTNGRFVWDLSKNLYSTNLSTSFTWKKEGGHNNLNEKFTSLRFVVNSKKKDYSIIKVEMYFGQKGSDRLALFHEFVVDFEGEKTIDLDLETFVNNSKWTFGEGTLTEIYLKPTSWNMQTSTNTLGVSEISFIKKYTSYNLNGISSSLINVPTSNYEQILSQRERFLISPTGLDNDEGGRMSAAVTKAQANLSAGLTFNMPLSSTATMTEYYTRIFEMAEGYAVLAHTKHLSSQQESLKSRLLQAIKKYLSNMNSLYYSKGFNTSYISGTHNWFDWEIDSPLYFIDTLVLIRNELTQNEIKAFLKPFDNFVYYPKHTSEAMLATARSCVLAGALEHDYARIAYTVEAVREGLAFVERGDGYHADGSVIQHKYYGYNGHYGLDGLYRLAQISDMLSGTCFALTNADLSRQFEIVKNNFIPIMYDGVSLDFLRGRLPYNYSRQKGEHFIYSLVLMTNYLTNQSQRNELMSLIKLIYSHDTTDFYYNSTSKYQKYMILKMLLKINLDTTISSLTTYDEVYKMYADMDVGFAKYYNDDNDLISIGIAMSSNRIAKYETKPSNNTNGWYRGDGMTYIYEDVDNYGYNFTSTADTTMLAGTTVTNAPRTANNVDDKQKFSNFAFVGGTQLGKNMAAVMQLSGSSGEFDSTLVANKSYFVFTDFLVCVGNGIKCEDDYEVFTVIENVPLSRINNIYIGNNLISKSTCGETKVESNFIYLVGYGAIFIPNNTNVFYKKTNNYIQIYLKHGKKRVNASYSYAIYPSKSATFSGLKSKIDKISRELTIEKNSIYQTKVNYQNVTQCVFWPNLNSPNNDFISMSGSSYKSTSSCVFIHDKSTNQISLSDPMQRNKTINLSINKRTYTFTLTRGESIVKSVC